MSVRDHSQDGITYRVRTTDYESYKTIIFEIVSLNGKPYQGSDKHPEMTRIVVLKENNAD